MFKRLAAMVYDGFLLVALWFLSAGILVALNQGQALSPHQAQFFLFPFVIIVSVIFYAWFWTHNGQTLGMQTWKIRLVTDQGEAVDLKHALLRIPAALLSLACFGMGYLWLIFDQRKCTWHDHLSRTRVVELKSH